MRVVEAECGPFVTVVVVGSPSGPVLVTVFGAPGIPGKPGNGKLGRLGNPENIAGIDGMVIVWTFPSGKVIVIG